MKKIEIINDLCIKYPKYADFHDILCIIVSNVRSISLIALEKIIPILEEVRSKDKLKFIDEKVLKCLFYGQEIKTFSDLNEMISLLLPEEMCNENLSAYLNKFGLFWDSNVNYNGLNNFKKLEDNSIKYGDEWSKFPILPFILCAYFYAHLEDFNYNYDLLIDLLHNYFLNIDEYVDIYKLSNDNPSSYENAYYFIELIIDDLKNLRESKKL